MLALVVVAVLMAFFSQLSFESLKVTAMGVLDYVEANPLRGVLFFAAFYFLISALPTPLISAFTMLAGYFFGNTVGLLITSFMSALGGTVLFLVVRYVFRDWVQTWIGKAPKVVQHAAGADHFGAALSLRFIPGLPFPVPAFVLALSRLSVWKFYVSTQLGLLIPLGVYVNAGRSLSQVESVQDVLSPELILSLLLLAIVPWVLAVIQKRWFTSA